MTVPLDWMPISQGLRSGEISIEDAKEMLGDRALDFTLWRIDQTVAELRETLDTPLQLKGDERPHCRGIEGDAG